MHNRVSQRPKPRKKGCSNKPQTDQPAIVENTERDSFSRWLQARRLLVNGERLNKDWPVKHFRPDAIYRGACHLIDQQNLSSADAFIEQIVLLPALATTGSRMSQGGGSNIMLYSIESRTRTPEKIHLWITPGSKIMVHHKLESVTLVKYLEKFKSPTNSFGSNYYFWKKFPEEDIDLFLPEIREKALTRWRNINTFPKLMELPTEIREKIVKFVVAPPPLAEPRKTGYPCFAVLNLGLPDMRLTLVSRMLYNLTAAFVYSRTWFRFHSIENYDWFMDNLSNANRKMLGCIHVNFHHKEIFSLFGTENPYHQEGLARRARATSNFPSRIRDLAGLRHLCIQFQEDYFLPTTDACRKGLASWFWAATRPYLTKLRSVQLMNRFQGAEVVHFLQTVHVERMNAGKGMILDANEMAEWQESIWSIE